MGSPLGMPSAGLALSALLLLPAGAASSGVSSPQQARASTTGMASPRWTWPLQPRPLVDRRFDRPDQRWSAGHRGIDLAASVGDPVRAVADGTVSHVGVINGRGTVSVLHASGIRSTHEPVTATVARGDRVGRGEVLGSVEDVPGHCAPAVCLHLGAKRGDHYLDPLTLLTVPRIVLLPPIRD